MVTEVLFHFCFPSVSILPLEWSAEDVTEAGLEAECNFSQTWATAKDFFANSDIDFSRVRVVVGGTPANFGILKALVIENTIYLRHICVGPRLLVHELVHIWQHQTKFWFQGGPVKAWSWCWKQLINSPDQYDFGGPQGLKAVLDKDPHASILTFGPEQQAEIVATYYDVTLLYFLTSKMFPSQAGTRRLFHSQGYDFNNTNITMGVLWGNTSQWGDYYTLLHAFAKQVVRMPLLFNQSNMSQAPMQP